MKNQDGRIGLAGCIAEPESEAMKKWKLWKGEATEQKCERPEI